VRVRIKIEVGVRVRIMVRVGVRFGIPENSAIHPSMSIARGWDIGVWNKRLGLG
jgi:hypothetical protein